MAGLITIDDPDDARLRDYTSLTDVEPRRRREPAEGLFIAEGEKVIRRARHAGYRMRSMLLPAKWVDAMRDVIEEVPAPVYAVSPELAEQVTGSYVAALNSIGIPHAGQIMNVIVLTAVLSCLNSGLYTASRMAFSLGQRGDAPKSFAKTNARGVPQVAILA